MATAPQRELTVRSILLGGALTFLFTAANVYFGLRVGLTFSTAIPAAVISMALLRILGGATIVENNIVQTIGSAAGAVGSMIFILPAFVIVGWWQEIPYWTTMLVCTLGGILGVMLSVPMRRALVIDTDLPYPEGVAGAEVLRVGMAGEAGAEENRVGLATIILGAGAGMLLGLLGAVRIVAAEIGRNFKFASGVTGVGASLSVGLVGVGHLIGLATGRAMLLGVVLARLLFLPMLSAGISGPIDEVVGAIFSQQVRFIGAGAIGIAAIWALVRVSGAIARGLSGIAAAAKARKSGATLELTERDLPGGIVIGVSVALFVPIAFMLWSFASDGGIGVSIAAAVIFSLAFILVIGIFTAVVTGYMAGLLGTSNSPVSGVGILTVLCSALLMAAMAGGKIAPEMRQPLIGFALFISSFVFGIAIVANDNLQDLKTGQLVGSTPWKQQVALIIGVVAGGVVIPPVLQLLLVSFGFAGMPGAGPNALAAPQASLFASIAQGVLGGSLRWDLIGVGAAVGICAIVVDELLGKAGKGRLPPLAVAMGIYLPPTAILTVVLGSVIGHFWDKMAERTARPDYAKRLGILLATGLIVGDSLWGLVFAGIVGAVGDPEMLAVTGKGFQSTSEILGIALLFGLLFAVYARTKQRAVTD